MAIAAFLASAAGCLWRERLWSAEKIRQIQSQRLQALLLHARAHTVLGAERLAHWSPGQNLAQIPPITKAELMERFTDGISGGALTLSRAETFAADESRVGQLLDERWVIAKTSGTTGRVGYFVTDKQAWARFNGALFARILRHRLIPREIIRFSCGRRYRMAMAVATGGHLITRLVSTFQPTLGRLMMKMRSFSILNPLEEVILGLNRYRPHYLHSYPTYVELLARAQLAGELKIDPEFISLGSEPVSSMAREVIGRAFPHAEVSETYGATECLTIANQCRHGQLHLNEDLCVLEPVDERGRPVPPGQPSAKVYLTNLINRAQPLIRYELPDSVTLPQETCPCGAGLGLLKIQGRTDDTFFLTDAQGHYVPCAPLPFEALFLGVKGLAQFQLIHERQNALRIRYVIEPGADHPSVGTQIKDRFHNHLARQKLAESVAVALEPVAALERETQGHKLRQIYSKVPRPAL